MIITTESTAYAVTGMTCSHCVRSVTEEVAGVEGVTDVLVDLDSGAMTVFGSNVDDDAVRAAVSDAGYEVAA